jgi:acyl-CoA synthetase (AMP-forming)/AMP-acid ligase II
LSPLIRNFRADFEAIVRRGRDRVALIDARTEQSYSYGALLDLLPRYKALFVANGAQPGSTIAALLPNSVEMFACFLATVYYGYGFAPLSSDATASEIDRWFRLTKPRLALAGGLLQQPARTTIGGLCALCEIVVDGGLAFLPQGIDDVTGPASPATLYLSTSGTTGEPKAMVIDSNVLWSSGCAFIGVHKFVDEECRFINILPMSYLGGLFNLGLIPLAKGGSCVIQEAFSGRSFFEFWHTVERFEVNVMWLVPSIVRGLLAMVRRTRVDAARRPQQIRACFLGTAPIDLATKKDFEESFSIPVLENFALSETTFFTSETLDTRHRRVEGSVGEVLPYVELRLAPVSSSEESGTVVSEIRVKTPFAFKGYLDSTGVLDQPVDELGFIRTGDIGQLDEKGRLIVQGRLRDIIKKGGYFVSLASIERLCREHEDVAEAAAVAVSHPFFGESFVLHVQTRSTAADNWIAHVFAPWLHGRLAKHMWPERILLTQEFPRTSAGKIRKHLMASAEKKSA